MRPLLRLRAHTRQKEKQARAYPPTSPAPQGAVSAAPVPLCPPPRLEPGLATVLAGKPGLGRSGPLYASRGGESRSPAGVQPAAGRHFLALRGDPPGPRPSAWRRVSPASSPRATRRKGGRKLRAPLPQPLAKRTALPPPPARTPAAGPAPLPPPRASTWRLPAASCSAPGGAAISAERAIERTGRAVGGGEGFRAGPRLPASPGTGHSPQSPLAPASGRELPPG